MFATRSHNENAIYEQQTAAAAKPLNQGVKGLAPKTPGNKVPKTPFKKPLNDENAAFGYGKTGGKGKEGGLFGKGEGGKVDRSAFVTPAGPRNRAPLGNKTTNAKATAVQTPAAPSTQEASATKPSSPRLRRAKVKIHTAVADPLNDNEDGVPEIEYMPPREVPLPDYPDDVWPHDRLYPQFEGGNLTRGLWVEFGPRRKGGEEGSEGEMSDFEAKVRKAEERAAEEARKKREKRPDTVKARNAVSALAGAKPRERSTPGFAAPTAAARAKMPSAPVSRKAAPGATAGVGNARHTAAKAASNTTLGYSKGRAISATTRKPLSSIHEKPVSHEQVSRDLLTKMPFGGDSTLDQLLGLQDLSVDDEAEDEGLLGGGVAVPLDFEDELHDFQLETPKL